MKSYKVTLRPLRDTNGPQRVEKMSARTQAKVQRDALRRFPELKVVKIEMEGE